MDDYLEFKASKNWDTYKPFCPAHLNKVFFSLKATEMFKKLSVHSEQKFCRLRGGRNYQGMFHIKFTPNRVGMSNC